MLVTSQQGDMKGRQPAADVLYAMEQPQSIVDGAEAYLRAASLL